MQENTVWWKLKIIFFLPYAFLNLFMNIFASIIEMSTQKEKRNEYALNIF